ncbi:DUF3885 domain-containing protein [Paenibacillus sp. IITD108]|uniref:DUF3885 domain-containing protein n=1 Tax=Paenibacillus sp. IITD108 TaxID=3116649 RepID=UPI002F42D3BC
MQSIKAYINENLPSIKFDPPFFYNNDIGIRFELGLSDRRISDETYFKIVGERALTLFESIFTNDCFLYVLAVSYESLEILDAYIDGEVDVFSTFFSDSQKLEVENIMNEEVYDEDSNELIGYIRSNGISCSISEINYKSLLGVKGGFSDSKDIYINDRIYFIEPNKGIVFHMYDSRGLDIVSISKSAIFYLYKDYNDWILDYDREIIDKIFEGIS